MKRLILEKPKNNSRVILSPETAAVVCIRLYEYEDTGETPESIKNLLKIARKQSAFIIKKGMEEGISDTRHLLSQKPVEISIEDVIKYFTEENERYEHMLGKQVTEMMEYRMNRIAIEALKKLSNQAI